MDIRMGGINGLETLRRIRALDSKLLVILMTAYGTTQTAIEAMKLGAYDYLLKPFDVPRLQDIVNNALKAARDMRQVVSYQPLLESEDYELGIVGRSEPMQQVFKVIGQLAASDATALITGESGTGKELAARAVHRLSPRRSAPFIAINCAALPESLIESELFGHEKGAFTGAVERRRGCFELAHGGTLLLDEIGEMPMATQSKLLRVLEERKVRRLGSPREVEVDVRLLAATNRNLVEEVKQNRFREDLFFRLNVFHVTLPPLRDRREDIAPLCETMVREMNERHHCQVTGIDAESMTLLNRHDWPGNARELRNVLERAVILAGEGNLETRHFHGLNPSGSTPAPSKSAGDDGTQELRLPIGTTISEAERAMIELTLRHTNNNRTRAAAILGISQKTLFNKLRDYGSQVGGE